MNLYKKSIGDLFLFHWLKKKKKKKQSKLALKKLIFISLGLLLLWGLCLVSYLYIHRQLIDSPDSKLDRQVFLVSEGEGLKQIATNLESTQLIKDKFWFLAYAVYKGWSGGMQAGEYNLSPTLNIVQIAEKIARGEVIQQVIKVTIPEGFTLKQADERLAGLGLIKEGELAEKTELEGYLFPDTYEFTKRDKLEDIILKTKENFEQKVDEDLKKEIEKQEKTIHEIVTMASLLEKEVAYYSEQRIVSGIFWKRIKENRPLQSCATLAYALGEDKWRYSIADTEIDSPYNTYQNLGLPIGPINNPGLLAIRAAVYPQRTEYYYFLSKPSGETVFSRTGEEHNENKRKYLDNN